MIMALNQFGDGYPQYRVILSIVFSLSTIRWISNCSLTVLMYLITDCCCDVTSCLLTGQQILNLNSPKSEQVKITMMNDL